MAIGTGMTDSPYHGAIAGLFILSPNNLFAIPSGELTRSLVLDVVFTKHGEIEFGSSARYQCHRLQRKKVSPKAAYYCRPLQRIMGRMSPNKNTDIGLGIVSPRSKEFGRDIKTRKE